MKGKNVIITGGANGIGLAMVRKFAKEGSHVFFLDWNEEEGEKVEAELNAEGLKTKFIRCDITDSKQVKKAIEKTPKTIDVLINNAGISHIGKVESTSEEDFDRVYQVNVKGAFLVTRPVILKMKQNGGAILNMASVAATMGLPDRFAYSMTKGAILSMTLSIARDYVSEGIRCNCLSPGRVHTPFVDGFLAKNYPRREKEMFEKLAATQPIGRMAKPEEIADFGYFICSEKGGFITGADYNIDGGFKGLKV
ncbi:SDR family NAD(P)-dependent oxidoreductase [Algoriphagus sediminis]|uniref:SDR family oxidoreductase n=1 Tax=Algoriphagus sediminis TaxID=3057113 RepID=A0ABT7Y7R1_9BACT|nr:SDR family oxidoreductase [Algoriphagus sediminis]MDN3202513.1 SDR family oxidoreductase [Algoriphagus sediminis]